MWGRRTRSFGLHSMPRIWVKGGATELGSQAQASRSSQRNGACGARHGALLWGRIQRSRKLGWLSIPVLKKQSETDGQG